MKGTKAQWDAATHPVHLVLNEKGENENGAKVRKYAGRDWLYTDDTGDVTWIPVHQVDRMRLVQDDAEAREAKAFAESRNEAARNSVPGPEFR